MKTKQIIDTLQEYNDWRRGKGKWSDSEKSDYFYTITAGEIGSTIDAAIERLQTLEKDRDEANAVEYSDLLANWAAKRSRLDAEYAKLKCLFGADPECSPVKAMYDTFGHYTKVLAKLVGDDDGWLDWYSWDNDNGAAKLEAKASNWQEPKPIVTTDDLLSLIANDKNSHAN